VAGAGEWVARRQRCVPRRMAERAGALWAWLPRSAAPCHLAWEAIRSAAAPSPPGYPYHTVDWQSRNPPNHCFAHPRWSPWDARTTGGVPGSPSTSVVGQRGGDGAAALHHFPRAAPYYVALRGDGAQRAPARYLALHSPHANR